jgi:cell wall-associated NlpC family hydrolase
MKAFCLYALLFLFVAACNLEVPRKNEGLVDVDSSAAYMPAPGPLQKDSSQTDRTARQGAAAIRPGEVIDTKEVAPQELVAFAKTQIGVPYLYGSTDPTQGFDCSGFITYVFNHFGIAVPRSSVDFTHAGKEVTETAALPGDFILFTGTDSTEQLVGHMGIVVAGPPDTLRFIHATSGKAYGVTITPLNDYYRSRYVKTIRVFAGR